MHPRALAPATAAAVAPAGIPLCGASSGSVDRPSSTGCAHPTGGAATRVGAVGGAARSGRSRCSRARFGRGGGDSDAHARIVGTTCAAGPARSKCSARPFVRTHRCSSRARPCSGHPGSATGRCHCAQECIRCFGSFNRAARAGCRCAGQRPVTADPVAVAGAGRARCRSRSGPIAQ